MPIQNYLVFLCVGLAAAFVGWRTWRTWRPAPSAGCGGGCGCKTGLPKLAEPKRIALGMERLEARESGS